MTTFDQIRAHFLAKGSGQYSGEPVTQLEHALQCAYLAEQAQAAPTLVTACLLHDIGHLSNDMGETPTLRGVDDQHQFHGANLLKDLFPDAVLAPIRLHVEAKRYLCAIEAGYWDALSADSRRSLELQGGRHDAGRAAWFIGQPHAESAIRLRRWDDGGKAAGLKTPDLEHYLDIAAQCAL